MEIIIAVLAAWIVIAALAGAAHVGWLGPPAKQGRNDLSEWEAFGGWRKRPPPPPPFRPRG